VEPQASGVVKNAVCPGKALLSMSQQSFGFEENVPTNGAGHAGEPLGAAHEKMGVAALLPKATPSQSGYHATQAWPAWQFAPGASGFEHAPVVGSHVPAT
jgi:hypothetical protein